MTDHSDEFPCENYQGVEFPIHSEVASFVAPDYQVGLNTVTYVKGVGMNIRVVNVPGSTQDMFREQTGPYDVCECGPPGVWVFTAFDPATGDAAVLHVLNIHDAVHVLRHPDHIFDGSIHGGTSMPSTALPLVPAEDGLDMVFVETQDHLSNMGVPGMVEDGAMTYGEVSGVDVDEMLAQFFGETKDDENQDG